MQNFCEKTEIRRAEDRGSRTNDRRLTLGTESRGLSKTNNSKQQFDKINFNERYTNADFAFLGLRMRNFQGIAFT